MKTRRILLVGGAGYIGSVCGGRLARSGYEVLTLDNLSTGYKEAAVGELLEADLLDPTQLQQAMMYAKPDAVFHFAARSIVGESVQKPLEYYHSNLIGTLNLLNAMKQVGCHRLVFSSTCAVFGNPVRLPMDEDHPKAPLNPYGQSKEMIERVLDDCRRTEGFDVIILRYFNAAGASLNGTHGEAHVPETHLIPLALDARFGRRPPLSIFGTDYDTPDGTCIRDYIHVEDLAEAHQLALEHLLNGHAGGAFNLGTGRGTTVREVLKAIEAVTGAPVPAHDAPRRPGDAPALYATYARAHKELGWTPRRSLTQIIEDAMQWSMKPRYGPRAS